MAGARRSRPRKVPSRKRSNPWALAFWLAGGVAAIFACYTAYRAFTDDVNGHWRLESIAKQKDAEIAATFAEHKSSDDRQALKAETSRLWVFWSLLDLKSAFLSDIAQRCRDAKKPDCKQLELNAASALQEATDAKRAAQNVTAKGQ